MKSICTSCGWVGEPKEEGMSVYRKYKGNCPACGGSIIPTAARAGVVKPEQLIQPPDPIIAKLVKRFKKLRNKTNVQN